MSKKKLLILIAAIVVIAAAVAVIVVTTAKKEPAALTMGTNASFPPYEYWENEKIVGIDAEIAEAIAGKLGMTLKIEDMDFNALVSSVSEKKIDMAMAGMTVTTDRLQYVNFSTSYATGIQSVIVPDGSAITSVDDLSAEGAAYIIGVQEATTGDIYCTDDFGADRVAEYKTGNEAVSALVAGKVDCVIIDNQPAKAYVSQNEGLKILDTEYAVEDYAIAIALDNTELLNKVNKALDELIADGAVAKILAKYIPAE